MYCSNCGAKLDDGAKFCHECGTPVLPINTPQLLQQEAAPAPQTPAFGMGEPVSAPSEAPVLQMPQGTPASVDPDPAVSAAPVFEMPQPAASEPLPEAPFRQDAPSYPEPVHFPEPPVFPGDDAPVSAPQAPVFPNAETPAQSAPVQSMYRESTNTAPTQFSGSTQYSGASVSGSGSGTPPQAPNVQSYDYGHNGAAAAGTKTKKKRSYILPIIIIFALVAVGYHFFFGGGSDPGPGPEPDPAPPITVTDPTQLDEYKEALEAMEDGDYDTAAELLEELYEEFPDSYDVYTNYFQALKEVTSQLMDEGDFMEAEPRLHTLISLSDSSGEEVAESFYMTWIGAILRGDCSDDIAVVAEKADPYLSEENKELLNTILSSVNDTSLTDVADMIASSSDNGDDRDAAFALSAYYLQISREIGTQSGYEVKVEGKEHSSVIFYYDDYQDSYVAYYGDTDDSGKRSGTGMIYTSGENSSDEPYLYFYYCGWENDLPNGDFVEVVLIGTDYDRRYIYSGKLVDGLYYGEITENYEGTEYKFTIDEQGRYVVIDKDENGYNIVAYATDGSEQYLYVTDDALDDTNGVDLYF